jgi:hypothetical protein
MKPVNSLLFPQALWKSCSKPCIKFIRGCSAEGIKHIAQLLSTAESRATLLPVAVRSEMF